MKSLITALILAAALIPACPVSRADAGSVANHAASPAPAGEHILFLHLRRGPEGVTLLDKTIRAGHLKALPANGAFQFEVVNGDGAVLQSGAMRDPAVKRLEYEDPEHPGQLLAREVNADSAEFTIRIPANSAARAVRFYLKKAPPEGKFAARASREFLGEVALAPKAETP
jgi:hypothetical protein